MAQQSNPFGHPSGCRCDRCQDWEDVQLGVDALTMLKAMKAKSTIVDCESCGGGYPASYTKCPNCGAPRKSSQTDTTRTAGAAKIVINGSLQKQCPVCRRMIPFEANFCPKCGTKQS